RGPSRGGRKMKWLLSEAAYRAARRALLVVSVLALCSLPLAWQARAADSTVTVGPLNVDNGAVTGRLSGFAPNSAVPVNGHTHTAAGRGTVSRAGGPVEGRGAPPIWPADPQGRGETTTAPLVDVLTGKPMTAADIAGPVTHTTAATTVTLGGTSAGTGVNGGG